MYQAGQRVPPVISKDHNKPTLSSCNTPAKRDDLDADIDALVLQVRANEKTLKRFQQVEMRFLSADGLAPLIHAVLDQCRMTFKLEVVGLYLADEDEEIRDLLDGTGLLWRQERHLRFADTREKVTQLCGGRREPCLGDFNNEALCEPFPHLIGRDGSLAALPLWGNTGWLGLLYLGSNDPQRYRRDMATDFLQHMAAVLGLCLENAFNQERLRRAGLVDGLTAVNNRKFFEQRVREEVSRAQRHNSALACVFIDIDRFKSVNDTWGHPFGDQVLAVVAQRIHSQLRHMDVLSRYGGEEFVALLADTDLQAAAEVAERIRRDIEQHQLERPDGQAFSVTVSLGVAALEAGPCGAGIEHLVRHLVDQADQSVYRAKETGRNRVVCFNDD